MSVKLGEVKLVEETSMINGREVVAVNSMLKYQRKLSHPENKKVELLEP